MSAFLAKPLYMCYLYFLLILPIIQLLFFSFPMFSIDLKLAIILLMVILLSFNGLFNIIGFQFNHEKGAIINRELFVNTSLAVSFFLLVMVMLDFSLSIKISALIFIIALNFLFLSLTLLNQLLFYLFMLIVSAAMVSLKFYLNTPSSTGLLTALLVIFILYCIRLLDTKKNNSLERLRLETKKKNNPEKLMGLYPVNDFMINVVERNKHD
jgi:hypothetical protein